jgi:hypothetical protein
MCNPAVNVRPVYSAYEHFIGLGMTSLPPSSSVTGVIFFSEISIEASHDNIRCIIDYIM